MIRRVLLLVTLVVIVGVVAVNLTVARMPAMPSADGKFIELHGKQIHYVEQPGGGTPVVMLHGLPGTHKDFDPVIPKLPGMHLFAIDRPGFGWSNGGWLPYQDEIDALHEFLGQLKISPAIVVGHSFGGTLALGLARRYPQDVAKLVLLAPGAGGMKSDVGALVQARWALFSQLPVVKSVIKYTVGNVVLRLSAHFAVRRAFSPGSVDPGYENRLLAVTLTPGNIDSYAREVLQLDDTMRWLDDNVDQIRVPSVVIAATEDQLVPFSHAQQLSQTLPGTSLVTVDGSHMIPYTHPDVVAAEIDKAQSGRAAA
jgi:pimeloyl-ACP methyl ester carboxylesterase